MGKRIEKTFYDEKRQMYLGRFHDFVLPSGNPITRDLISFENLEWEDGKSRRRRRSDINKGKVLSKLYDDKKAELEKAETKKSPADNNTAKDIIQRYLDEISDSRSGKTVKEYARSLNYLLLAVGNFDIKNPPEKLAGNLLKYLRNRGITDHSINSNIQACQIFFNWCDEQGVAPRRYKLERARATAKKPKVFSQQQMDDLLALIEERIDNAKNERNLVSAINQRRAFMMFRYTGLRAGELRCLPLNRISLKHKNFLIADVPEAGFKVKTRDEAYIPIAKTELVDFLEKDLEERKPGEIWYLDDGFGGLQWNNVQTFGRVFDKNLRSLGIEGKRTHGFRATVISRLLNRGTSVALVQILANHKKPATTIGYFTPDDSEVRKQIEANL